MNDTQKPAKAKRTKKAAKKKGPKKRTGTVGLATGKQLTTTSIPTFTACAQLVRILKKFTPSERHEIVDSAFEALEVLYSE